MSTPTPPAGSDPYLPPPTDAGRAPTASGGVPRTDRLPGERPRPGINPANEETTVLAPVSAATDILNRIPLTERRRWQVVTGAAAGLALVMSGLSIYLWVVSDRWEARAAALEDVSYDLGDRLSEEQDYVVTQQEQITLLSEQLATAQDRIVELADEKSQAGDAAAFAQQQIDYLDQLAAAGGSVSLALNRCVNEMRTLVGYWKNIGSYTPSEVQDFEDAVLAICTAAQNANASFQQQLAQ